MTHFSTPGFKTPHLRTPHFGNASVAVATRRGGFHRKSWYYANKEEFERLMAEEELLIYSLVGIDPTHEELQNL